MEQSKYSSTVILDSNFLSTLIFTDVINYYITNCHHFEYYDSSEANHIKKNNIELEHRTVFNF